MNEPLKMKRMKPWSCEHPQTRTHILQEPMNCEHQLPWDRKQYMRIEMLHKKVVYNIAEKKELTGYFWHKKILQQTQPHPTPTHTVVWNDYLLIFWPNVIFYFTRSWKPNANINQICWITKVSTHSKTLIQFSWKFIYFKDVYWWFFKNLDLWQNEGAIHISNYWLCLNVDYVVWFVLKLINKILLMAGVSFA